MGQCIAKCQCAMEIIEHHQGFEPRMCRCQRNLDFKDQSIGAPQMVHAQGFRAAQLDDLRLRLDRHRADAQHIAGRGQRAVVDRAHAAEAAAKQAAQRRAAVGGGNAAHFLSRRTGLLLQFTQPDSSLSARDAGADPAHRVEACHVEHDTAG